MKATTTKNNSFKKQLKIGLASAILASGVLATLSQYSMVSADQQYHGSSIYSKLNHRRDEDLTDTEIYERARQNYLASQENATNNEESSTTGEEELTDTERYARYLSELDKLLYDYSETDEDFE